MTGPQTALSRASVHPERQVQYARVGGLRRAAQALRLYAKHGVPIVLTPGTAELLAEVMEERADHHAAHERHVAPPGRQPDEDPLELAASQFIPDPDEPDPQAGDVAVTVVTGRVVTAPTGVVGVVVGPAFIPLDTPGVHCRVLPQPAEETQP